jgi:hypothetical protein
VNFVIYFILTYGLPIWLGFLQGCKDVATGFRIFLVLQGYLMDNNIISLCDMESLWYMETIILTLLY